MREHRCRAAPPPPIAVHAHKPPPGMGGIHKPGSGCATQTLAVPSSSSFRSPLTSQIPDQSRSTYPSCAVPVSFCARSRAQRSRRRTTSRSCRMCQRFPNVSVLLGQAASTRQGVGGLEPRGRRVEARRERRVAGVPAATTTAYATHPSSRYPPKAGGCDKRPAATAASEEPHAPTRQLSLTLDLTYLARRQR